MNRPGKKISLADTPVRRALARAGGWKLWLIFAAGVAAGLVYRFF